MDRDAGAVSATSIILVAVIAIAAVAFAAFLGPPMFSPGPLNATTGPPLGGVASHAKLGSRCWSCHTAFWSSASMSSKCLACHADVGSQIESGQGRHAAVSQSGGSEPCLRCHTEHKGAKASITRETTAAP